jgi:hypothetical protein
LRVRLRHSKKIALLVVATGKNVMTGSMGMIAIKENIQCGKHCPRNATRKSVLFAYKTSKNQTFLLNH